MDTNTTYTPTNCAISSSSSNALVTAFPCRVQTSRQRSLHATYGRRVSGRTSTLMKNRVAPCKAPVSTYARTRLHQPLPGSDFVLYMRTTYNTRSTTIAARAACVACSTVPRPAPRPCTAVPPHALHI